MVKKDDKAAATRGDLSRVEKTMKGDLSRVEKTMKGDLSRVEQTMKGDLSQLELAMKGDLSLSLQKMKAEIIQEIKGYFDLTVENIRHDLLSANREEIEVVKDRVTRLEVHTGLTRR